MSSKQKALTFAVIMGSLRFPSGQPQPVLAVRIPTVGEAELPGLHGPETTRTAILRR
jgi:hypothetical protein